MALPMWMWAEIKRTVNFWKFMGLDPRKEYMQIVNRVIDSRFD